MEPARQEADQGSHSESELFREQAIIAAAGSQFGEPLETYWRGTAWFIGLSIALVTTLFVLLVVVTYSPTHQVPAYVDVPGGLVRIGAPADSRVHRISVEEGALVHVGDVVAVLNTDQFGVDGGSRSSALQRGFAIEQSSLAREIVVAREEAVARRVLADRMVVGLRAERLALLTDLQAGSALLESLRAQSEQTAAVAARGFVSKTDAARKRDDVLAQESRLAISRGALARIERDMEAAAVEARISDHKLQALIESRQRASDELDRSSQVAAVDAEQVIRAPVTGFISTALIAPGQSVVLGQPMFTVVAKDAPMMMRLLVPPRAAGSVRTGVRVKIHFAAYPREKFGEFEARIDRVTSSPLLPSEFASSRTAYEPAYLATATLLAPPAGPDNEILVLKPGMLGVALVPIEKRRAIEWLFEPLIRGFNGAGHPAAPSRASPPAPTPDYAPASGKH